ncbi:hypothetical protein BHYA_0304g00070 [Botrytis hyacinthi]|uniref:Uncharacterized protein n=1 Tax=Botrytis hyacinthi TaxID=278943 RepID=A0A4Z1GBW2_9HELO|nr:hypothetical protein BHYA_0304g00070 [Botrytis hyacinthi]
MGKRQFNQQGSFIVTKNNNSAEVLREGPARSAARSAAITAGPTKNTHFNHITFLQPRRHSAKRLRRRYKNSNYAVLHFHQSHSARTNGLAATQKIVKPAKAAAEMLYLNTSIYKVTSKTTIPAGAHDGVKPTT